MPTADKGKYEKLRRAAQGQSCVRCGVDNGTTVLAHIGGPRAHLYGRGMGHKGHDAIAAWLCRDCHEWMDVKAQEQPGFDTWAHSEEWHHYVALTIIRLFERGVVK